MQRHDVRYTHRIKATEQILARIDFTNVLEIGAGDYSFDYLQKGRQGAWAKIDLAPPCDVLCNFNAMDVVLPFRDSSFDLIVCTEVLEHLLWPQELLKECRRVLSQAGYLLVSVPNVTSLTYRVAWLFGHIPSCAASANLPTELGSTAYRTAEGKFVAGHVIDFNLKKVHKLITANGFEVMTTKGSGLIWYRQIVPAWLVPTSFASNIVLLAKKMRA